MEQNSQIDNIVIAVDGFSASGKTKLTKELSKHYNIPHLFTGNLYRAFALKTQTHDIKSLSEAELNNIANTITTNDLESKKLNNDDIASLTSQIAQKPIIRKVLSKYQRDWIASHKISIVEGRDIGTVICPNATVKLFLNASAEIRAKRRFKELSETKQHVSYEDILNKIQDRDHRDQTRANAPLKMANDAQLIDTTHKTIKNMIDTAIKIIEKKIDNIMDPV